MNNDVQLHLDATVTKVRALYEKAITRIEALKPGEKIPATVLAEDIAKEQGMTGPALYPVMKMLFDGYPGVEVRKGAHGGIRRLPLPGVVGPTATEDTDTKAE